MTQAYFQDLLRRYLAGECTTAEQQLVEGWYASLGGERTEPVLPEAEQAALRARLWQQLAARTVGELPVLPAGAPPEAAPLRLRVSRGRRAWPWVAGLSGLLLLSGAGWWGLSQRTGEPGAAPVAAGPATTVSTDKQGWTTHLNRTGQVLRVRLPDGSVAALNPQASLRFPARFGAAGRPVELRGEAFFWVEKNPAAPFQVLTRQLVTTVLGTSFRVREGADGAPATVAVSTGRVAVVPSQPRAAETQRRLALQAGRVSALAAGGVVVLPNQQAVFSEATGRVEAQLVDKPALLGPARHLTFTERPVAEVLAALEKAYGVRIAFDAARLRHCTVNVTFYDEPLFEKLGILSKTLGAYYQVDHTRIVFHGPGCEPLPSAAAGR